MAKGGGRRGKGGGRRGKGACQVPVAKKAKEGFRARRECAEERVGGRLSLKGWGGDRRCQAPGTEEAEESSRAGCKYGKGAKEGGRGIAWVRGGGGGREEVYVCVCVDYNSSSEPA